jgi:hypothetical protein
MAQDNATSQIGSPCDVVFEANVIQMAQLFSPRANVKVRRLEKPIAKLSAANA